MFKVNLLLQRLFHFITKCLKLVYNAMVQKTSSVIKEINTVSHMNDLYVECMNVDPTDPNKEEGSFELD